MDLLACDTRFATVGIRISTLRANKLGFGACLNDEFVPGGLWACENPGHVTSLDRSVKSPMDIGSLCEVTYGIARVAGLLTGGNELQDFLSGLPNVKNFSVGFGAEDVEVGNVRKWLADEDERPMMEMCSLFRTK